MVAAVYGSSKFTIDGEQFNLVANFRILKLIEQDVSIATLFEGIQTGVIESSVMSQVLWCLTREESPNVTEEDAFALVFRHADIALPAIVLAITDSMSEIKDGEGGKKENPRKRAKAGTS